MNWRVVFGLILAATFVVRSFCQQTPVGPGAEEANLALRVELLAILDDDQRGRSEIDALTKAHGFNSPEVRALWSAIAAQDAVNLAKVTAILDRHGWLGPEDVGPKANNALFLVLQHADLATQQKYLPLLRAAVIEKKALPRQLALLEDRVALAEGRRQRYGSQLFGDPQDGYRYHVSPIEDPDHVDERRAAVGLEPMAENLKRFHLQWDLNDYKKELPQIELMEWGGPPNPGGYDQALQTELLAISEDLRRTSLELADAAEKHGRDSPEFTALQTTANHRNAVHLAQVKELIDERGWITLAQVGRLASQTVMQVFLQSADVASQQKYLPRMRAAVKANQADASHLAMVEDHVAFAEGRRQVYGTQLVFDETTRALQIAPLEDPEHVDDRRASMGLEPLAGYARTLNIQWDLNTYKQQLPDLETRVARNRVEQKPDAEGSQELAAKAASESENRQADEGKAQVLVPFLVTAPAYKQILTPLEKFTLQLALDLRCGLGGWPTTKNSVLTPERVPQSKRNAVYHTRVLDEETLAASSFFMRIDRAPFHSEYTRIRNEPNHASDHWAQPRVLRDGVLVNDPFDGSLHQSELPVAALARIEFVPNGGASAWGETPTGLIQLFTTVATGRIVEKSPSTPSDPNYPPPPSQIVVGTGGLVASVGEFGMRELEFVHTEPTRVGMLQLLGRVSSTNGFIATHPRWQGTVDTPEWARHHRLEARWRRPLGKQVEMTASVQTSEESQGLGTPKQREHTRAQVASLAFAGQTAAGFAWNGVMYANVRDASRTFSAVNFDRSNEVPVIDQVSEPVRFLGLSWTGAWNHVADAHTNFGIDLRTTHGETKSRIDLSDGFSRREIIAEAEETKLGLFAIHHRRISSTLRGMVGVRLDSLGKANGNWHETNRISGASLDKSISRGREVEFSPSIGLVWGPSNTLRIRTAAQESFRQPTMAERYRVLGERNQIIEPNLELKTERTETAEMSITYSPSNAVNLTTRLFISEFRDSPGTLAIANTPTLPVVFAVVPPLVEHLRRITLDRVRSQGVEVAVAYRHGEKFSWESGLRLQESGIIRAIQSPRFEHHELPGMARVAGFTQGTYHASAKFSWQTRLRWLGREFMNEENSRQIGETVLLDAGATYALTELTSLYLEVENLGNVVEEIMRSSDGVIFTGAPRTFSVGVRKTW